MRTLATATVFLALLLAAFGPAFLMLADLWWWIMFGHQFSGVDWLSQGRFIVASYWTVFCGALLALFYG